MKFIKLALAASLLQLIAACDSSQKGLLADKILAAERGDVSAQIFLGRAYYDGDKGLGVLQDYAQGLNWYRKAAEQGDAYALRMLAHAHYYGHGVSKDYAQAADWYRKAAEQGDPYAQFWLGSSYYEGLFKGLNEPQDIVLGYAWLNVASNGYYQDAESLRNKAELALSPAQLAEAQRLSSNWRKGQSIQREKQ